MPQYYPLYVLNSSNRIQSAYDFLAANDSAAREEVEKHPDGSVEVWQGARLVARTGFAKEALRA